MPRGRPEKQAEATTTAPANGKPISKLEAVKRSLAELGNDAKPGDLQAHVKKTFGLDMSPNHVSNCKSLLLGKGRRGKRRSRKVKPAVQETVAQLAAVAVTVRGGITLDDVRAVKELSGRLGADRMLELVKLVGQGSGVTP
jgi:hypothetical protein